MGLNRKGSAEWSGGLKGGHGIVMVESGLFTDAPYGFASRFESGAGTNPEELIGAAHAACFSMAFSGALEREGFPADKVKTQATVTVEKVESGFAITKVHLETLAKIPGIDDSKFHEIAASAKAGCPVSKVLNAEITLDAKLED